MKRIYLDHAAATPVDPRVLRAMTPFFSDMYGNPGAIHWEGVQAKSKAEEARRSLAEDLGIHADEIVLTASATESANLALRGVVHAWKNDHPKRTPHIVVGAIEHEAVLAPSRALESEGVSVTRISVDEDGIVDLEQLSKSITEDTVVISIMYANNEIGTIQPIREIASLVRKWKKEHRMITRDQKVTGEARYPLFHTDATQAANYCDMRIPRLGVDLLTMNAAKIYGPKGIGLLAVLRGTPIAPIVLGGGQERGLRAGTEHVPAIIGFAKALKIAVSMTTMESSRLIALRDLAQRELRNIPGMILNGSERDRLPNNVHFSLPDTDHEFLALALDARGFAVATKSACDEHDAETSHVLEALRIAQKNNAPKSGIRLSLGRSTTKGDITRFISTLKDIREKMFVL